MNHFFQQTLLNLIRTYTDWSICSTPGYTGSWGIAGDVGWPGGHWTIAFNDSYPTPHGRAPNNIFPATDPRLDLQISTLWWNDAPLVGVYQGCPGKCKAKLVAPGLFPTR